MDRFIDIVRAVENTPRGGEWTMEWTHRGGQRDSAGRYGARDLSAAAAAPGAPTAVGVAGSVRALAPGLPRGPENFELVRVDRSRGRVGTHISYAGASR